MAIVRVVEIVEAPASVLFDALADWGGWKRWLPMLSESELESGGARTVGSVRRVGRVEAPLVRERLVMCDVENLSIAYAFEGPSPYPVREYVATVRLIPLSRRQATVIEWCGRFDVDAADEAGVREAFEDLYRAFIGALAELSGTA